jgi:hypothetical protein
MGCRDEWQGEREKPGRKGTVGCAAGEAETDHRAVHRGRKDGLMPGVQRRARDKFSDTASRPGGGFAILARRCRILSSCGGSVMMIRTFMGWPQREQLRGSSLWTVEARRSGSEGETAKIASVLAIIPDKIG